jgi:hypothetical protein
MNRVPVFVLVGLALTGALLLAAPMGATAGGVVGDGTPASCTDSALDTALAGGGTISFNCGPSPVTILVAGTKTITVATIVDGDSLGKITISGGDTVRIFDIPTGVNVELLNLVLSDAKGTSGGAIRNFGTLRLTNCRIASSAATYGGGLGNYGSAEVFATEYDHNTASVNGGAIDSTGVLTVTGVTVHDNSAVHRGGGLYNYLGKVDIRDTQITTNTTGTYGGGIGNDAGTLHGGGLVLAANEAGQSGGGLQNNGIAEIQQSFVGSNQAGLRGAGIASTGVLTLATTFLKQNLVPFAPPNNERFGGGIYTSGKLTGFYLTLDRNTAPKGGGLWGGGNITLVGSSFLHGDAFMGGGIYIGKNGVLTLQGSVVGNSTAWFENAYGSESGTGGGLQNDGLARIESTAFVHNSAAFFGGGILNQTTMTLTNSTVDENQSGDWGAGIGTTGVITVVNSTLADNTSSGLQAGNLALFNGGRAWLQNTILSATTGDSNCLGYETSLGNNLSSDASCRLNASGDISNTAALLLPMGQSSGYYRVPQPASPAINHGNNAACPAIDQRGVPRPLGGTCDIGAIEVEFYPRQFFPLAH